MASELTRNTSKEFSECSSGFTKEKSSPAQVLVWRSARKSSNATAAVSQSHRSRATVLHSALRWRELRGDHEPHWRKRYAYRSFVSGRQPRRRPAYKRGLSRRQRLNPFERCNG